MLMQINFLSYAIHGMRYCSIHNSVDTTRPLCIKNCSLILFKEYCFRLWCSIQQISVGVIRIRSGRRRSYTALMHTLSVGFRFDTFAADGTSLYRYSCISVFLARPWLAGGMPIWPCTPCPLTETRKARSLYRIPSPNVPWPK